MKSSLVIAAIFMAVASADISHLVSRYLPPNNYLRNQHHSHHPEGNERPLYSSQKFSNERVETTIEKHKVIELPIQTEIIKEGQHIYAMQSPSIKMFSSNNNKNEKISQIKSHYEMPMKIYLPPVALNTNTNDVSPTKTIVLSPTTGNKPTLKELITTKNKTTTDQDTSYYPITNTKILTQEHRSYNTNTSPPEYVRMAKDIFLQTLPMTLQNQYLEPLAMMLPPPEPTPQLTYQQYQQQLMRAQHMQQMSDEQEMQAALQAIIKMNKEKIFSLKPQQQQRELLTSVEPGHVLRQDGYHYKTTKND